MLKNYQLNIFVRVIKRKQEVNPDITLQELFDNDYPKLSQEDRDQIETTINNN